MKEFVIYFLENSLTCKQGYFLEFLWVIASEYTPADKSKFKVDNQEMFQEYYSGVLIISLENIFEVCDRV